MNLMWVWTKHSKAHLAEASDESPYASAMCHNALGKIDGRWSGNSKAMVAHSMVPDGFCRRCQRIEQEAQRER